MDSLCHVRNLIIYVLSWWTVSALTWVFLCLFPSLFRKLGNKHQKDPLMSAETVRHSSTYIILYIPPVRVMYGSSFVTSKYDLLHSLGTAALYSILCCTRPKRKIFTGPMYKLLLNLSLISDVYRSFIPIKPHLLITALLKAHRKLSDPLSKTIPGKFCGSGMLNGTEPVFTCLGHDRLS